jgi:arabinofuranan 3-O-arabinosyltransferase
VSDAPNDILAAVRRFLTHRLTRLTVCWLLCLAAAVARWYHAYHCFDSPPTNDKSSAAEMDRVREDRNNGHTWIDFGGQYVFGRTAVSGHWRELYHRDTLRRTADAAYPIERQSPGVQKYHDKPDTRPPDLKPEDVRPDAERLLRSMMGDDVEDRRNDRLSQVVGAAFSGTAHPLTAAAGLQHADDLVAQDQADEKPVLGRPVIGGPLYPPVHSLYYAPLGLIGDSQLAYFLFQLLSIVTVFVSGLAVRALTRGRVWWPVATTVLFLLPGMRPGIDLGQNHAITLMIVLCGWAVAARCHQFGGGMIWGLLAFKPVWGLAFILAPILLRKWKFVAGTGVAGVGICLATLPFVGVEGWKEWLQVGKSAAALYNIDENWINLSRDVSGIPKRFLLDFTKPKHEIADPNVDLVSNVVLGCIAVTTVLVGAFGGGTLRRMWRVTVRFHPGAAVLYFLRGYGTSYIGLRAGFVLIGGFLSCYRFMYYDSILVAVGLAALLAYPKWALAGWRGELREADQSPARRRTYLFVNSFPFTILVLLLVTDTLILYSGNEIRLANDGFQKLITDPAGGTVTKQADDGTTTSAPKTKWVHRSLTLRFDYNHPVETFFTFALWVWCGWRLLRHGDREKRPPPT